MSQLKVVTVATDPKYYFHYLKESINNNNNELIVLGYGEKWQGFSWKYKLMLEYLNKLSSNDIVCFVDGYDVICTRNLNEMSKVFYKIKKEENCKIIVGYERHINFLHKHFIQPFFGKCNNMPLNSGTYIGFVKDLIEIINHLYSLNDPLKDDQMILIEYCNRNPREIYIDKKSELFLSIGNYYGNIHTKELVIKGNTLFYNNENPFFLHGFANSYMDNILIKLGYKDVNINLELRKDFYKNIYFKFNSFLYNISFFTLFLLIIIIILLCIFFYCVIYNITHFYISSVSYKGKKNKK